MPRQIFVCRGIFFSLLFSYYNFLLAFQPLNACSELLGYKAYGSVRAVVFDKRRAVKLDASAVYLCGFGADCYNDFNNFVFLVFARYGNDFVFLIPLNLCAEVFCHKACREQCSQLADRLRRKALRTPPP